MDGAPIDAAGFDPRLRDGGDPRKKNLGIFSNCFDPRLRDGGDVCGAGSISPRRSFDPRLRDGGDQQWFRNGKFIRVSIHASVMEATVDDQIAFSAAHVSIHASVMEATSPGCP